MDGDATESAAPSTVCGRPAARPSTTPSSRRSPISSGAPASSAALLIISDGADTASTATLRDVRSALLRNDAFVYAIAIDSADAKAINARVNVTTRCATSPTRAAAAPKWSATPPISPTPPPASPTSLNSQYLIGYTSPKGADGAHSQHSRESRRHGLPGPRAQWHASPPGLNPAADTFFSRRRLQISAQSRAIRPRRARRPHRRARPMPRFTSAPRSHHHAVAAVDERRWRALVGIDLTRAPGTYPVRVDVDPRHRTCLSTTSSSAHGEASDAAPHGGPAFVSPPASAASASSARSALMNETRRHPSPDRLWKRHVRPCRSTMPRTARLVTRSVVQRHAAQSATAAPIS